jgi:prevent-host-death family protein
MREMGVRELKQSLSETLRSVGRGEQVRITVRGKAVADIVPAGVAAVDDPLRELVAEGRITVPSRSRSRRAPHLAQSQHSASSLVLSEREAES